MLKKSISNLFKIQIIPTSTICERYVLEEYHQVTLFEVNSLNAGWFVNNNESSQTS